MPPPSNKKKKRSRVDHDGHQYAGAGYSTRACLVSLDSPAFASVFSSNPGLKFFMQQMGISRIREDRFEALNDIFTSDNLRAGIHHRAATTKRPRNMYFGPDLAEDTPMKKKEIKEVMGRVPNHDVFDKNTIKGGHDPLMDKLIKKVQSDHKNKSADGKEMSRDELVGYLAALALRRHQDSPTEPTKYSFGPPQVAAATTGVVTPTISTRQVNPAAARLVPAPMHQAFAGITNPPAPAQASIPQPAAAAATVILGETAEEKRAFLNEN